MQTKTSYNFTEQILNDLIKEGYSGKELQLEFLNRQKRIRPAVESMLNQAKMIANDKAEYSTYEDIFDSKNKTGYNNTL